MLLQQRLHRERGDNSPLDKTLIVFGCSDRINDIKEQIPDLIENYDTFGINDFVKYYKTKFYAHPDKQNLNGYDCIYCLNGNEYKPYLIFESNVDLFWAYTTASLAVAFAESEGYEKVILYGVLDGNYSDAGNDYVEYRYFYEDCLRLIPKENLIARKHEIFSRENIEVEIPFLSLL